MQTRTPTWSRGVALISVLLIVAIGTVIATAMTSRQQLDIRRSANLLNTGQAYEFALGVEAWGMQVLARDRKDSNIDNLEEDWATLLPPMSLEGGRIAGHLEDLQGRFNLNMLLKNTNAIDPEAVRRLQRLLKTLGLDEKLAWKIADWIDPDQDVNINGGAEDTTYIGMDRPYRTADTYMASPSELLMIEGFDRDSYNTLAPFVMTLPYNTPINVNTASAEVLTTLSDDISLSGAEAVIDARKDQPFDTIDEFNAILQGGTGLSQEALNAIDKATITLVSDTFLAVIDSEFGRGRVRLFSVIRRDADAKVMIWSRSQGVL